MFGKSKIIAAALALALLSYAAFVPGSPAQAQASAQLAEQTTQSAKPADIKPAQIETLLSTLKDENERNALISKLETLLAVADKESEVEEAEAGIATAMSDIVTGISDFLQEAVTRLSETAIALTDVKSLVPLFNDLMADPGDLFVLAEWIGIIAAIVIGGLVAVHIVSRLIRRPVDRLETWAAEGSLLHSLAVFIPVLLLRALRAVVFFAVTQGILTTIDATNVQLAGRAFVFAVTFHLVSLAIVHTLLKPTGPLSRSLQVPPATGAYLSVWANRVIATGIYGVLGLDSAYILGLPYATYLFLEKVVYGVLWALTIAFVLQNRSSFGQTIAQRRDGSSRNPFWSLLAAVWHLIAIAYVTAGLVILMSMGDAGFLRLGEIAAFMIGIMIVWRLGWLAVDTAGRHLFSVSHELTDRFPSLEKRANRYVPHVLGGARVFISIAALGALLEVWGLQLSTFLASENGQILIRALATIVLVGGGAVIISEVVSLFVERRLKVLEETGTLSGRERTLLPLLRRAVVIVIGVLAIFVILSEIGVDITPLLAGAGVVGLAIGFGSQSLVKDVISGIFLLIEDTLNVGDYVDVGGKTGTVEALSIRTLRLRDVAGDLHTIPFGSVDVITNMTKEFAYALVDVGIAYREDADAVMKLLSEIGNEMVEDEKVKESITGPFEVFGVQDLADSSVNIRTRVKTRAGTQWSVRREFLRRVKRRFDAEGIEIPFPHQTLYFGEDKDGSAPPAYVKVSQARARKQGKDGAETGAEAEDYFQTANPEMADAEAARNAEKDAQDAERRRREEEQAKAAEEARETEEELAHDDPVEMIEDGKDPDKKTRS
ncbi:mechanosensitive ion channel [Nisaea acidiphila]|uniref:Mechanosensitive ion channel n=1 Tax=Nisaea acidiphila TaxID=1862145 RepID=A0A9J7APN2_9PROT|nr:mechanosensitive ion channel domain-containing protein [Nisaea acidiphila]UUX49368.1 mechanosensitive ion channel [Nisaea acidiphila]